MKQFLTVLKFELNNYFKNKSFVLTTIVLMVLAAGIIALPGLLMGRDDSSSVSGGAESGAAAEETDGTVALFDKNGNISDPAAFGEAMGMNIEWVICTDSAQVEDAVNEGNAEAGFIVEDLLHYTYVVENRSMSDTLQSAFSQAAAMSWRAQTLTEEGLDPAEIESLYQVQPQYETQILGKDSAGSYAYTYMLIMILYFLLIFYGQMIATSVTSEKSNRAIEILVTSVDRSKTDGYAFIGDFLKYKTENMIPEGSIVVEVCNTNYYAYRVTDDYFKELIAQGKRGSLHQFIVAVDEALKDSQSIIINEDEEALSTIQPE